MSDLFPERIATERLVLERLGPDTVDLFEYYEICSSDPGIEAVTERMPWDPHEHPKESLEVLERVAEKRDDGEAATYAIRPRESEQGGGEFAGQTTLHLKWDKRVGVLGIWLRKRFWGRGYSGERAAALLALAFERLDLDVVAVSHEVGNDNSRRAIEKYVDRFDGRREGTLRNYIPFEDDPRDGVRYTISQEEYLENRPSDLEVTFDG